MIINGEIKSIGNFNTGSILLIGDLMLDRYLVGTMSRISPEAPAPLIDIASEIYKLGGAANAVNKIRDLGGRVLPAGVVGDDWFGKQLAVMLEQENLNERCIIEIQNRPTTVKTRVIAGDQQILRFDRESTEPIDDASGHLILDYMGENTQHVGAILISDYNKGLVTNTLLRGSVALGAKYDIPVIIYPKVELLLDYNGVTLVITDLERASTITGIRKINETSIRNMGHWLLRQLGCRYVLITHEKDGFTLFERNGSVIHIPSIAGEIRNITGSIDLIASIIALSQASGAANMIDSVHLANIAVGIYVEKLDDAPLSQFELTETIKKIIKKNKNKDEITT